MDNLAFTNRGGKCGDGIRGQFPQVRLAKIFQRAIFARSTAWGANCRAEIHQGFIEERALAGYGEGIRVVFQMGRGGGFAPKSFAAADEPG
ncbi:MAG: hypothetical protein LBB26_02745 [Puniceicoccales bacterium]|nr:hypothetical protein [Puniceicoccales bacterium]